MNHPTNNELQDYVDQLLEAVEAITIEDHLRTCSECQVRTLAYRKLSESIRRMATEQPSREFTRNVMSRLHIEEKSSMAWKLFQYLAPLVALTLVSLIVVGVMYYSGSFQQSEVQQSVTYSQQMYSQVREDFTTGMKAFSSWAEAYLPFALSEKNYSLTFYVITLMGLIALFDKLFLTRILQRKH